MFEINNKPTRPILEKVVKKVGSGEDASGMEGFHMARIMFLIAQNPGEKNFIVTKDGEDYLS